MKGFDGRRVRPAGQYLLYDFPTGVVRGIPEWTDNVPVYRYGCVMGHSHRTYDAVEPVFRVAEGLRMTLARATELIDEKRVIEAAKNCAKQARFVAASALPFCIPPEVAKLFRVSGLVVPTSVVALANSIRGILYEAVTAR